MSIRLIHNWLLKRQIKQAIKILARVDKTMNALRMLRWKRKQIWRDLIKSEKQRMNIMNILNGVKP